MSDYEGCYGEYSPFLIIISTCGGGERRFPDRGRAERPWNWSEGERFPRRLGRQKSGECREGRGSLFDRGGGLRTRVGRRAGRKKKKSSPPGTF